MRVTSTPFMVSSVTYIICEGPELDTQRSQSVMYANRQYSTIHAHKVTFKKTFSKH